MTKTNVRKAITYIILTLALVLTAVFMAACSENAEYEDDRRIAETPGPTNVPIATLAPDFGDPKPGGTLKIGSSVTNSLNPLFTDCEEVKYALMLVYDNFVNISYEGLPKSGLAESWETVDNKNWHFTLKEGVTWHDGTEFTAADVIDTLNWIYSAGGLYRKALDGVTKYYNEGNRDVYFELETPNPLFTDKLCFPVIKETVKNSGIIEGTGPFMFLEQSDESVTFVRYENYYGSKPMYEKVQICFYESDREKYNSDCDVLFFDGRNISAYSVRNGYSTYKISGNSFYGLIPGLKEAYSEYDYYTGEYLYLERNIAATENGRKALYYCIDREKMINTVLSGSGIACDWPVYSGFSPKFDNGTSYTKNLEKAYELLKKENAHYNEEEKKWYYDEAMTHPVKINIYILGENTEHVTIANCLKEDFEAAGLTVQIQYSAIRGLAFALSDKNYTLMLLPLDVWNSYDLKEVFGKDGEYNFNEFNDKTLEALFRGVEVANNTTEIGNINENIENILDEKLPMLGLFVQIKGISISDSVGNFDKGKYGFWNPLESVCEYWYCKNS